MQTVELDELTDGWVEIAHLSPRLQRAIRRLIAADLSTDGEYVIAVSMEKFLDGSEEHGALDIENVDDIRESLMELIDLSHYGSMRLVKLMRRNGLIQD